MKKLCAQCHCRLGLGVRFRNYWSGFGWKHLRFCSSYCQSVYETEHQEAAQRSRWLAFLNGQS